MNRVDNLLRELSVRYQNTNEEFLTAVRPLAVNILDEGTPETARVPLLEMLAETFQRDVNTRTSCEQARAGIAEFFEKLQRLLRG